MRAWPQVEIPQLPGRGLPISLMDTATGKLRVVVAPGEPARLYVCGITPYDSTHMGHAATYVAFDVLQRAWRDAGSQVTYVQNVTDIDDPLLERAAATGDNWEAIAAREVARFTNDLATLHCLPPEHYVTVTEHMAGIVEWIGRMVERGRAYQVDDDLYFDTTGSTVGELCGLDQRSMIEIFAQRGGDPSRPGKRNPLDPLLWKARTADEPFWPSPFGDGRPGWHVECVAIAADAVGLPLSVQGGGRDLVFPHHDMCAAEVASVSDRPFADAFMHAGMVSLDGEKMSKSLGNLVFVSNLRDAGIDPMAIRLAISAHHYRDDWEWTDAKLAFAQQRLSHWRSALALQGGADSAELLQRMREALAADLDTPAAIAAVDDWATRSLAGDSSDATAPGLVARALDALLGLAL